ncbi:MAG TPA: MBL fold metallo-hydrolase [Blastocatellia bacterium]|nr:MBL fold metallo-hydrolase [Blastocatellia bacterium]
MRRNIILALTLACALCGVATAQDAKSVIEATIKNMGDFKSVQFSGGGAQFNLGQSVTPDTAWPRGGEIKSFSRTFDYDKLASRNETVNPQGTTAIQFLMGDKAWNQAANVAAAPPAVMVERQLQLWLTPHGFLRGALANKATAKKSGKSTILTFTVLGKYKVVGSISAENLVEKVEASLDNAVLGDMSVETTYSDYRDLGGFKFPAKMVQKQGGFPVFDLAVTEAKGNVALELTVPDAVSQATPPAVRVTSEKLSDGVWYLAGGSHHSVALEFADHVAVIEAPLNEDRSNAVIAEVKKLIPAKPIRYLINTHHHFDHSGGLRTYVAEGATIVTHQSNKAFYERTFKSPHTLNPDRQWREKKKAKILAIGAKHVMSDSSRLVELHHIQDNPHNSAIIMAWLPKEKLLVEVDVYGPLQPNAPLPASSSPTFLNTANLYENIQRLNLDVNKIVPLHGRIVDMAELKRTIGK